MPDKFVPARPHAREICGGTPYRIQPGDTLAGLACRFGYTQDALLAANLGMNPRDLPVNCLICLPPAPGSGPFPWRGGSIYIVQPGDSLPAIAHRFGCPLHYLIKKNTQITNPESLETGTPIHLPH